MPTETYTKRQPWNKGKKGVQVAWNKGLKGYHAGTSSGMWKGDKAGYSALHYWISGKLGKASKCINGHIAKRYFWANISGEYKRDINDYHELCQSCNQRDGIKINKRFNLKRK